MSSAGVTPRHRWNRTLAQFVLGLLAWAGPVAAFAAALNWAGIWVGLSDRASGLASLTLFVVGWLGIAGCVAAGEVRDQRDEYRANRRLCRRCGYPVSRLGPDTATCPECDATFRRP